ncbi:hypothetical protein ACFOY4_27155 [Actinomadura syzygii]|uniref:DUF3558 domain-containing protein n=1 Tax=Actinomadura syzygii TaxID=1427538 RepID=A0A5D0UHR6_9ACTN|nr:hypothetical protein [Actinomadura syzygii]TYC17316.1 hypothetical protein FXF65_04670 [Actinomadura syzygii]
MGLQRPPDPFDRVYSAPEPPSPGRRRRSRRVAVLVAVVAFGAAAVAVFLLAPVRGGGDGAAVRPTPSRAPTDDGTPTAESTPTDGETPAEGGGQVVKALPAPCGTVSQRTVDKTVPKATRRESANSTLTTCTYSSTGRDFRWLRIEAHLYAPGDTPNPVRDAESYYDAQWTQAHHAPLVRTISLEPHKGLGDEAYRWFKADEGQPTVVGQVTARIRNAVFTVSYSERAPAKGRQDERKRACLAKATDVAVEVMTALNHF